MKKQSRYTYSFRSGIMIISKGIKTRFDWLVEVELTPIQKDGYIEKRVICLDQRIFLTKREAKETTEKLLSKFNLL